ncbi:MAG: hypothetical protein ABJE10_22870 [bacterium]
MNINSKVIGSIRPVVSGADRDRLDTPAARLSAPPVLAPKLSQTDSVQISDAGRANAAAHPEVTGLHPDRTAEIHQRILTGAYNSLDMVESVAKRILDNATRAGHIGGIDLTAG